MVTGGIGHKLLYLPVRHQVEQLEDPVELVGLHKEEADVLSMLLHNVRTHFQVDLVHLLPVLLQQLERLLIVRVGVHSREPLLDLVDVVDHRDQVLVVALGVQLLVVMSRDVVGVGTGARASCAFLVLAGAIGRAGQFLAAGTLVLRGVLAADGAFGVHSAGGGHLDLLLEVVLLLDVLLDSLLLLNEHSRIITTTVDES